VENRIIEDLGGIYGPYTGRWFASKFETDIEHMVARSEGHDSGLCAADPATRRRFSHHSAEPLTLAGPRVNRFQKSDGDAAEWAAGAEPLLGSRHAWSLSVSSTSPRSTDAKRMRWTRCWPSAPRRT